MEVERFLLACREVKLRLERVEHEVDLVDEHLARREEAQHGARLARFGRVRHELLAELVRRRLERGVGEQPARHEQQRRDALLSREHVKVLEHQAFDRARHAAHDTTRAARARELAAEALHARERVGWPAAVECEREDALHDDRREDGAHHVAAHVE